MYDSILFPTDGSDTAMSVLDYAIDIAAEHRSTLHVLSVVDTDDVAASRDADRATEAGERVVTEAAQRVTERGVTIRTEVRTGVPLDVIVELAKTVSLVVMGTHGRRNVDRALLGSVTEGVLGRTSTPVVVVNPGADRVVRYPSQELLVPTDGTPAADRALEEAIDVAAATDARLHLLHVIETETLGAGTAGQPQRSMSEAADALVERAGARARERVDDVVTSVCRGHPYREIRRYADEEHVDLVALGTGGETAFDRYTLGGVSSKLLRTASVPVVVTRAPTGTDES